MASYLDIQTRVERAVIDLPAAVTTEVPLLINEAMVELQDKHNFFIMEALQGPLTTTLNTRPLSAGVPSNFKEFRGKPYMLEDDGHLRRLAKMDERIDALAAFGDDSTNDDGEPKALLIAAPSDETGTRAYEMYPYPDGASDFSDGEYRVYVPYWKYLTALSADADTNWFTVNAERWLIEKATSDAFFIDWDEERGTLWAQRALAEFNKAVMRDKKFRLSSVQTLEIHKGALEPRFNQ